jgi:response regulator RpfG family c-di-GMP phosphodiesterase
MTETFTGSSAQQSDAAELAPEERTCLIVDDEPRLRQVLARLMRSDGFECFEASSGVEALAQLQSHRVMIVLTDLRMPHMDGVELLTQIRGKYPDMAVIMATAVSDVDVAVRCLNIGAMDYLTKPFTSLEDVRARVAKALEKRKLILENRDYQVMLESRVAEQARRLENMFLGSIQAFAVALEAKDKYTRGHSIRVAHFSTEICRVLGLSEDVSHQVELGGQLHDIGKIGVREEVLNKPAPLTPEEYAHIMTHPVVGWRILSPLLDDSPIALNIVRSHHERYDGRGIPDSLAGSAIPLEARIAAVADAYDAMTSGRPYRGVRMTLNQVLDEMIRNRGTQFDPNALDAFLECVRTGRINFPDLESDGSIRTPVEPSTRPRDKQGS